ncbi:MAG: helix-turn-helix transcriptional regulator [Longimicrobiales bacterium]|nr:helix-turn-helix transcriptional regulator [Longimicrobiales bacterium]
MIRSEAECRKAKEDLARAEVLLDEERAHWLREEMAQDEAFAMTAPLRLRTAEMRDEIGLFERIRTGDLSMFVGIEHVGAALVAARIARGLSQREFAELVEVHESQVSRDERNEYQGVGRERMSDLMRKLGLSFEGQFRLESLVMYPRLVSVEQPVVYLQAAGLTLDPEEVERELRNAVA